MTDRALTIYGGGLSATISPVGATLRDLRFAGSSRPLLMAFQDPFLHQGPTYANTVVGRVANRLGGGVATLGQRKLTLEKNAGVYHLHGGRMGFSHRTWQVHAHEANTLTLCLESVDGEEGYPGTLRVTAIFALLDPGLLDVTLTAETDKPTLVNLTHHLYFDLDANADISTHRLWLAADQYLESDLDFVPTGAVADATGTIVDFSTMRTVALEKALRNHTMIMGREASEKLCHAATLEGAKGVSLELWTNQPAVHFYDGYKIPSGQMLTSGKLSGPHAGLCLEPQQWTDAPNHAEFPSIELTPGSRYHWQTEYRFRESGAY